MKKLIKEARRMQQLAGLLKENNNDEEVKWSYPDVDDDDFYYEHDPEEGGYTVHLPVKGIDSQGNAVKGIFITSVPEISSEILDDLDFDPSKVEIVDDEDDDEDW